MNGFVNEVKFTNTWDVFLFDFTQEKEKKNLIL